METSKWNLLAKDVFDSRDINAQHPSAMDNIMIAYPALLGEIEAYFPTLNKLSVLDYGCGTGDFAKELSQRGAIITGVDTASSMVEIAKDQNIQNASFICTNIDGIKNVGSFDLIVSNMVMQFVDDPKYLFQTLIKMLKSKGLISIIVHNDKYIDACINRNIKFFNVGQQLNIKLKDVFIPIYKRPLSYYEELLTSLALTVHSVVLPPFTKGYIELFSKDIQEPIDIPKYFILSFKKN